MKKERETNWVLIGGIIGVAAFALLALLLASASGLFSEGTSTAAEATERAEIVATVTATFSNAYENLDGYCGENEGRCVSSGDESSDIVVLEFSDYACPHCATFNQTVLPQLEATFINTEQVHYVVMPFAILTDQTGRARSIDSANAAICAFLQDHDIGTTYQRQLFLTQDASQASPHSEGDLIDAAEQVGVPDMDAFETCVEDQAYGAAIIDNNELARQLGVNSTPSVFVNGTKVDATFDNISRAIVAAGS